MNIVDAEYFYMNELKRRGLFELALKWLKESPPPPEWKCGPYAYAYTEMAPWVARIRFSKLFRAARSYWKKLIDSDSDFWKRNPEDL